MTWTARVDQLSNNDNNTSGVCCVRQIHAPGEDDDDVDDIIRVQFNGDPGQTSGDVRLKISGYVTDVNGGSKFIDDGHKLDTEYTFKLEYNSNDWVTLYCNEECIYTKEMDVDQDDNYFKVGIMFKILKNVTTTALMLL